MTIDKRRDAILEKIQKSNKPIKASELAKECSVTRQVVVNDISILRAKGNKIIATSKGYIIDNENEKVYLISCNHNEHDILEELYTIVDCGCGILNVTVEHDVYGEICGNIHVFSRFEVDEFVEKLEKSNSFSLSVLTNNQHMHALSCPTNKHYEEVVKRLTKLGFIDKN